MQDRHVDDGGHNRAERRGGRDRAHVPEIRPEGHVVVDHAPELADGADQPGADGRVRQDVPHDVRVVPLGVDEHVPHRVRNVLAQLLQQQQTSAVLPGTQRADDRRTDRSGEDVVDDPRRDPMPPHAVRYARCSCRSVPGLPTVRSTTAAASDVSTVGSRVNGRWRDPRRGA